MIMEETHSWMNTEILEAILKASSERTSDKLTVLSTKVTKGVEEGKNNCSAIYRLHVDVEDSNKVTTKSFIVKKVFDFAIGWYRDKENSAFRFVLPQIEQFVETQLSPRLFLSLDSLLVMEDLAEKGFRNVEGSLLNFDHCALAVEALAKFHAGSIMIHKSDPRLIEETVGWEVFKDNPNLDVSIFMKSMFSKFQKEISTWPESDKYAGYFSTLVDEVDGYLENLTNRGCRVLNHGDFWLNNMMFRYSQGVCEVKMVDFQMCRFTSPSYDLQYFVASSADLDVRLHRLDELYGLYLDTMNRYLPGVLTEEQLGRCLHEDAMAYWYGMTSALCVVLSDPELMYRSDGQDFNSDVFDRFGLMMKSSGYRELIPRVLDDLARRGLLSTGRG
uniref:CHK kinase-like domain-containing protein n=1 Tax=Clastoptera arizonana TaxID=38151 RepID=A0A1B6DBT8_9HEMI